MFSSLVCYLLQLHSTSNYFPIVFYIKIANFRALFGRHIDFLIIIIIKSMGRHHLIQFTNNTS